MTQENILNQLCQLKLTGMANAFSEQTERPPIQDLSFNERLALLLD